MGNCRLCLRQRQLQKSHIVPAFFWRWFKATSGTGYIRLSVNPNLRVQDGPTRELLCSDCEQLLSRWENQFAEKLFPMVTEGKPVPWDYGEWLANFAVSLCWRGLIFHMTEDSSTGSHLTPEQRQHLESAVERWRMFLLGKEKDLGLYDVHQLPLGPIQSYSGPIPAPNMNRYMTRSVDIDIVGGQRSAFVFFKLGPICFLGFIQQPQASEWKGTKIDACGGQFDGDLSVPGEFGEYLNSRAFAVDVAQKSMSSKQRERITETMMRDIDRAANSESFRALEQDIKMTGREAVFGDETTESGSEEPKT